MGADEHLAAAVNSWKHTADNCGSHSDKKNKSDIARNSDQSEWQQLEFDVYLSEIQVECVVLIISSILALKFVKKHNSRE